VSLAESRTFHCPLCHETIRDVFRYDFNSPYAYLAAHRVDELFPGIRWQPIAFAFLLIDQQREPWSFHDPTQSEGKAECERRAAERGLPPMTWPPGWPQGSYTLDSLRVALVAEEQGLLKEYSLAAFARNFVAGTGLLGDAPLEVAEEIGLDRAAAEAGLPAAKARLKAATEEAIRAGVVGVPTVTVGDQHFWGDDRLEDAAARVAG
jgi:2-hydroxychromene-2-carboxylate isomerase